MDINDLRTLATVLVAIAFTGIVWWAFGPSRKKYFDEAAQLPFTDETTDSEPPASEPSVRGTQAGETPDSDTTEQPETDDKHKGDKP
jgi:cytochrome c oxidase cbb3-type subunit IV